MKLRLEIEIDFSHSDDPSEDIEAFRQELDRNLLFIAQDAAGNGAFTSGIPEIDADTWDARVVRLA